MSLMLIPEQKLLTFRQCFHRTPFTSCLLITRNTNLFRYSPTILYTEWVPKRRQQFKQMDPQFVQARKMGTLGLELRKLNILGGLLVVDTSKRFGASAVSGHYYGTMVYYNLSVRSSKRPSVYGECIRAIPLRKIMKWALHVGEQSGLTLLHSALCVEKP